MTYKTPFLLLLVPLLLGSCKETEESQCAVVAEMAHKCLSKSRDISKAAIMDDCEEGLKKREKWTWAAIDCQKANGDDCVKWVECIQKDPYPTKDSEAVLKEREEAKKKAEGTQKTEANNNP